VFEQLLHLHATNGRNSWTKRIRLVAQSIVHFVQIANALIEANYYPKVGQCSGMGCRDGKSTVAYKPKRK
jgi:hypothetical protein